MELFCLGLFVGLAVDVVACAILWDQGKHYKDQASFYKDQASFYQDQAFQALDLIVEERKLHARTLVE